MSPLATVAVIAGGVCAAAWIASVITREHSWVDRVWSIVPVVYVWVFAASAGFGNPRLNLMAALVTLWGARLTFNFARKGGYSGVEDYRWAALRTRMTAAQFQLFNLVFIALFQNLVLVAITLPALTAWEHPGGPLGVLDLALAVLFTLLLTGETIADQQQWNFHGRKKAQTDAGRVADPRFLQTGLFRYSRHPNFFFEQAQWWVLFFFGTIAAGSVLQWTAIGVVLLAGVFTGSTIFTESITCSKYPEYSNYQKKTSAIVPWPPRARVAAADAEPPRR